MTSTPRRILVTGSAGYIGSHAAMRLVEDGHTVVGLDDLSRGNRGASEAIASTAADAANGSFTFVEGSISDTPLVSDALRDHKIDLVMHFAALAYVGESVEDPLRYFRVNVGGAISLLEAIEAVGVEHLVFSSTCATYGEPSAEYIPINESCSQAPINPYGRTKLMVEHILRDHAQARRKTSRPFSYAALRYFNVAGSDPQGRIGEDHQPETHLIPICLEVAAGKRDQLVIYGDNYPTPDGTCIRDYVHVVDLVDAHVAVMNTLEGDLERHFNVGIGTGVSVKEILQACQDVTGREIAFSMGPRREGDPPILFADAGHIHDAIGWKAQRTGVREAIEDAWRWMQAHPDGYAGRG